MIPPLTDPSQAARPQMARNDQAVGQQAKAAVADARSNGVDLPGNAQGIAASGIARGADPASLFQALVTPPTDNPPVVDDTPPVTEPTDGPDSGTGTDAPAPDAPADLPQDVIVADGSDGGVPDAGAELANAVAALQLLSAETTGEQIDQIL